MPQTISDYVWPHLHRWGISQVFGHLGDGTGGLGVALERERLSPLRERLAEANPDRIEAVPA